MSSSQGTRLRVDEVYSLAQSVLSAHGCDDANSAAIAKNMAAAEGDGCASHGLFRLAGHVASLRSGKANGTASPEVSHRSPVALDVDGDHGFAPSAHDVAIPALVAAARQQGVAVAAIRRTHHFAALWPETERVAQEGLVAMTFVSSAPYVAPAGGTRPVFGTNPMAFGWPRKNQPPLVWDQASAAMARGEVKIAARDGESVPVGVGVGPDGNETTDPAEVLEGAQLAFGGYKGASIALMVDLMAGPLLGEVTSLEAGEADNGDGGPATGGETLVAFDPALFGAINPDAQSEALFGAITEQPGARLPGERRLKNRARSAAEGVIIAESVIKEVEALLPRSA